MNRQSFIVVWISLALVSWALGSLAGWWQRGAGWGVASGVLLGTGVAAALMGRRLMRVPVQPAAMAAEAAGGLSRAGSGSVPGLSAGGGDTAYFEVAATFAETAGGALGGPSEADEGKPMRSQAVNRAILEAVPFPVFVVGDDSRILLSNPAAEKLTAKLGLASGQLPHKVERMVEECRRTRTPFLSQDPREAILFRVQDEEVYYLPCVFHFEAADASQSGWAVQLHNVSRIRWLDDLKTNLLASVSHEIKTPLTGIRMVLHLLLEERSSHLDERQRILVSSANNDCERLLTTLNALFELSRAESGTPHLKRMPMVLYSCIERVTRQFTRIAAARRIDLRTETDGEGFPEILADPVRLDEVLNNLVSNAIKHSPEGGVVSLRLSKPDANFLRVSVSDQGPGIPEALQSRIFERFFRCPGQEGAGLGLGLFISREIMRAHDGRIGLLDGRAGLTQFYIDVPIA